METKEKKKRDKRKEILDRRGETRDRREKEQEIKAFLHNAQRNASVIFAKHL